MSYIERVQKSIDYIEEHLDEELTLDKLASMAYCSRFHYHRIFQHIVGDTLMQYIRKRKLARAADQLTNTDKKIIDIAVSLGFNSHVSFTRLFKKTFGLSPEEYRRHNRPDILLEKVNLNILKFNGPDIDFLSEPRIIERDAFHIVGVSGKTGFVDTIRNNTGPLIFEKYILREEEIKNKKRIGTRYGVIYDYDFKESFNYLVCVEVENLDGVPEGLEARTIPASKYAVFTYTGKGNTNYKKYFESIFYIYAIWFPKSGYAYSSWVSMLEVFDERCTNWNDRQIDICLPIK